MKKKQHETDSSARTNGVWLAMMVLVSILFLYIRLHAISQETVPYTYDQGRDFMAARNIVVDKNIKLIGPTTGAEGVFHGAWWYYFLTVPFILFQGQPLGFYYFIAFIGYAQVLLFSHFLKKEFSTNVALLFAAVVAAAPYFIKTSVFAINSVLTLPFILLLMYSLYMALRTKKLLYMFLIGWSAGMIAEAELAFGIFLFPSLLIAALLSGSWKDIFGSIRKSLLFLTGLGSAMVLRAIFELKNNFLQTRALFSFTDAAGTQPNTWLGVFKDRIKLFTEYYLSIFPDGWDWLAGGLLIVGLIGLGIGYKNLEDHLKKYIRLIGALLTALFLTSLLYKNSFFWEYYFEGIHYVMIVLVLLGMYSYRTGMKSNMHTVMMALLIAVFVGAGLMRTYTEWHNGKSQQNVGLLMHTEAIEYLYGQVGKNEFCLRMYTPPVRTHTYDYLLDLQSRSGKGMYPRTEFVNDECWYFIESDSFAARRQAWLDSNLPSGGSRIQEHEVSENLIIEKWTTKPTVE